MFSIIKAPIVLYAHLRGAKHFLKKLEKLKSTFDFESSQYVDCAVWNSNLFPVKKEWYQDFEYMEFEGIQVKVSKYWNEILTMRYGDYMKLPPTEQQVPTHDYELYYK